MLPYDKIETTLCETKDDIISSDVREVLFQLLNHLNIKLERDDYYSEKYAGPVATKYRMMSVNEHEFYKKKLANKPRQAGEYEITTEVEPTDG